MIHEFNLSNLDKLDDGRLAVAFNQALSRAVADCQDRPMVGKARLVKMTLAVVPVIDEAGFCETVDVQFAFQDGLPARSSKTYSLGLRKKEKNQLMLVFNDMSEDDINQRTIDMPDD